MQFLAIFLVALAGGLLPLLVRWTDRLLHSALALSTGIFLGAVFLHMLPSLSTDAGGGTKIAATATPHGHGDEHADAHDHAHAGTDEPLPAPTPPPGAHHGHDHGAMLTWLFVLLGVLGVYLLEGLVFRSHDHDDLHRHRAVGFASLAGLTAHSITNGLGFGAALQNPEIADSAFLAVIAHKGFETFSLATVFQLAQFPRRLILFMMPVYAAVTPLSAMLGRSLFADLSPSYLSVVLAIAAGTFLYVCLCELLPELFHHKEDSAAKIGLLVVGIVLMILVAEAEG